MRHIVTSRDNVQFVVNSDARTVPFDQSFAAARMAEALDTNPDFARLGAGPGVTPSNERMRLLLAVRSSWRAI